MDLKIFTDNVESSALQQIYTLAKSDVFMGAKIRIMPDVHAGAGCVIGFTADLGEKVVPNLVGVDIGCGMLTSIISEEYKELDLKKLDDIIHKHIPSGRNVRSEIYKDFPIESLYCYNELSNIEHLRKSIGTLGGGNHFIEVSKASKNGTLHLIIHTGSRNLGKQVAEFYQKLAVRQCADLNLVIPKELSFLTGKQRVAYLHDMELCQDFAVENRKAIADIILSKMEIKADCEFETIHNYIDHNSNIIRKGAISARDFELLLIPINMRDGSILGLGKGNEDWNYSAPHGAGRLMSRSVAKANLTLEEFEKAMEGIYTTSVSASTLDESPMAYKSIDEILSNIVETVAVVDILKPIYNFKASE